MTSDDPIKAAWQASGSDAPVPAPDELRTGADRFYRLVRGRNRVEYGASVLVVVSFIAIAFNAPSTAVKLGALLVVLGTLVMAWQLHRRASATPPPGEAGATPLLEHQRAQLVRQHNALARVWLWYLLPLAPGLLLILTAPAFDHGIAVLGWGDLVRIAVAATIFAGVWWLNQRTARALQRAIDELDATMGGNE